MSIDFRMIGAGVLLAGTLALSVHGDPTLDDQLEWRHDELQRRLVDREVQIDPGELLELMHDNLVRLRIVDVRDEADFNLFHLADSEHLDCDDLRGDWGRDLPTDAIVIVVGNDETRAEAGWRMLSARGVRNAYLLAGGLNGWLTEFGGDTVRPRTTFYTAASTAAEEPQACGQEEPFLWMFPRAVGERHPAALPSLEHGARLTFEKKVERLSKTAKASGGCG